MSTHDTENELIFESYSSNKNIIKEQLDDYENDPLYKKFKDIYSRMKNYPATPMLRSNPNDKERWFWFRQGAKIQQNIQNK